MDSTIRTFLILCAVILLAVPALSHAGSATSRGDPPTGGTVQIPIIPEKRAGYPALALRASTVQDKVFLNSTQPLIGACGYKRNDPAASGSLLTVACNTPVTAGGWAGLSFYLGDTAWASFYYGQAQTNPSQWRGNQQYVVNLVYNPNPVIRLGFEYTYYTAGSARGINGFNLASPSSTAANGLQDRGTLTVISVAAQYLF